MTQSGDTLSKTPLGEELGEQHCHGLAALMQSVSVAAGDALFAQGDKPDALYVVTHGSFNVLLRPEGDSGKDDLTIAIVGPGGVVGELEVFTGAERMASVVASENASCLKLPASVLADRPADSAASLSKLVDIIAKVLAVRLAAVNRKLMAAWSLPEAGHVDANMSAPPLRDVLDDVWAW